MTDALDERLQSDPGSMLLPDSLSVREFAARMALSVAWSRFGQDMTRGVVLAVVAAAFGRLVGIPWDWSPITAAAALVLVFAGHVIKAYVGMVRQPERHERWEATDPQWAQGANGEWDVVFYLSNKAGFQAIHSLGCEVVFPDGHRIRAVTPWRDGARHCQFRHGVSWSEFGDSRRRPTTGTYRITWFELSREEPREWRQLLQHFKLVDLSGPSRLRSGVNSD